MTGPRRAPDGRFVPKTGDAVLPPKPKMARDEHGRYLKREKLVSSKPYSRAVREIMEAKEGGVPETWDLKNLTEAQSLVMTHIAMAKAGNVQLALMMVDRAEGKVPLAAEDREAQIKAGQGVRLLADLLGIKMDDVIDAEVVQEPKQLEGENEPIQGGVPEGDDTPDGSTSGDLGTGPSVDSVDG